MLRLKKLKSLQVNIKSNIPFLLLLLFFVGCSSSRSLKTTVYKKKASITYYHDKFNGRKTASGAVFSNSKMTAAHRRLPFGTQVRITNLNNNKSVEVEINDRGPVKKNRELDVTKKAFMDITDNKNHGILEVKIELLK